MQIMEKKSHFLQKIFDPKKIIFHKKAKKNHLGFLINNLYFSLFYQ